MLRRPRWSGRWRRCRRAVTRLLPPPCVRATRWPSSIRRHHGPSKGVRCPQAQLFRWGVYSARALGILEGDTLFTTLPLFHTNALNAFYQAMLNGCTYVLEPKFSASGFWAAARRHNATVGYLLGAMAVMLLSRPPSESDDRASHARGARRRRAGAIPCAVS